jgi:hypothetical protein
VLVNARDLIHKGYVLLTHPLYGNFLPNQQPYRTLILSVPEREDSAVDPTSLYLIEEALSVFRRYEDRWALPGQKSESVERDYAVIDADLMEESLNQNGFRVWRHRR